MILPLHHLDAYDAGLVVEKKGVAVKESLITAVSNDADMITRRLSRPPLNLMEKVGCRWNHILKENHTVPTHLCPFGCDR